MTIFQPGNLPVCWYGSVTLQITRNWLYRKCSDDTPGSFCVAVLYILYVTAAQKTSAFLMGFMVYLKRIQICLGFLYRSFSENTIRADIAHGKEAHP